MPTALIDFEAPYGGQIVEIRAGITRVHPDHELAIAYPRNFGEAKASRPATKSSRSAASSSRRSTDSAAPPPVTTADDKPVVVISSSAHECLLRTDCASGLETAGGLYGTIGEAEIVVEAISENSLYAPLARTGSSVEIDWEALRVYERHFRQARWALLGVWHSHPSGALQPSRSDRLAWRASAGITDAPWLSLILAPRSYDERNGADWSRPRFGAWLTKPGATVITPLRTIEIEAASEA
jgi:integrative and conjugative element protein (TIGR02256 family)